MLLEIFVLVLRDASPELVFEAGASSPSADAPNAGSASSASSGANGANGANTAGRTAADGAEEWELFDLTTDPREVGAGRAREA